jgi:hypothetical protein
VVKNIISIQGLVDQEVLNEFDIKGVWYFVSYAIKDFPIGTLFENKEGKRFKLINVHLQFKNCFIDNIPEGYKTMCQFDEVIENQITIDTWIYNKNAVELNEVPLSIIRDEKIDQILS